MARLGEETAQSRRAVLVGFGVFGAWWGGWGVLLPAVQRNARLDYGDLGTALLFVGIGALASMRLTGAFIDRFGQRVLPVTLVAFALAGVFPGVARGVPQLSAALLVVGMASGAVDVGINAAGSRYEAAASRPVMNLAHAVFSVGVIGGSAIVGILRTLHLHPRVILGLLGAVLVASALWLHLQPRNELPRDAASAGLRGSRWRWWAPPRRLLGLGILAALAYMVENAWQSWSALHLERTMAATPIVGALGPVVFGTSAALGRFVGHWSSEAVGQQKLVRIGAATAAVGIPIAAGAPTIALVLTGIAVTGFGTAVCAPGLFSLAGSGVAEDRRGATIGTVTTFAYLGFVLSPAAVGLAARLTSLPAALAATSAAAVIVAIFAGRVHGGRSAE